MARRPRGFAEPHPELHPGALGLLPGALSLSEFPDFDETAQIISQGERYMHKETGISVVHFPARRLKLYKGTNQFSSDWCSVSYFGTLETAKDYASDKDWDIVNQTVVEVVNSAPLMLAVLTERVTVEKVIAFWQKHNHLKKYLRSQHFQELLKDKWVSKLPECNIDKLFKTMTPEIFIGYFRLVTGTFDSVEELGEHSQLLEETLEAEVLDGIKYASRADKVLGTRLEVHRLSHGLLDDIVFEAFCQTFLKPFHLDGYAARPTRNLQDTGVGAPWSLFHEEVMLCTCSVVEESAWYRKQGGKWRKTRASDP